MRLLAVGVLVLITGCTKEVPKQLESSFSMATHSMAFANFAEGYPDSTFDAELAVRMFGPDVCQNGASPCELTPSARAFVKRTNRAMGGGRCEGFAVMASLFESGRLDPVDFEGANARELTLPGNTKLQRELAYWFSTQLVSQSTSKKTKQYMAKDVMPALVDALSKDSTERWRIGIVRKKGTTISGGHALTPIGYYSDPKEKGVYWLRVYDNNRPDSEHLMKIDTVHNRWEFEASENPEKTPRLYYGDDSNKNPLYLAPILTRQGVLPCEFCKDDGTTQVTTTGGAQVSAGGTGVTDGNLSQDVVPGFSALDDEPATFFYTLPTSAAYELSLTHPDDADYPYAEQSLEVAGRGFTVSVQDVQITATDRLQVQNQGSNVQYTNASGGSLALKTELALADGGALAVAAVVDGKSSDVSATVDPQTGSVTIAAGNSAGSKVTMVVTTTNGAGEETTGQLTFTSEGDGGITADTSAWSNGDPLTGTVTNNGMTMMVTNACEDQMKSGMETDVDCGAVCMTKCAIGQGCDTGADCDSGFCHATTKQCVATSCEDGVRSGQESDVDCGGTCGTCAVGQACVSNDDCAATAACVSNVCRGAFIVGIAVNNLPLTDQVVLQNNGGDDLTITGSGSFYFPTRVTGAYDVTILTQPSLGTCTVVNGSGTATADVSDVQVNCTPTWALSGTVTGLPMGETVVLQNGAEMLTVNGASFTFNTRVAGAYAVTIATQPTSASCVVTNGSGTATADVSDITVTCSTGFTIGGTVSGLPMGDSVVLQNNGGDDLTVTMNGNFSFSTQVTSAYAVTILTQPTGVTCVVSNSSGAATANVTDVTVTCGFTIGGTLTGLPAGQTLHLQNNGGDDLYLPSNGPYSFTLPAVAYSVVVATQPNGANCVVANSSGTAMANVGNVDVTCTSVGSLDPNFNMVGWLASPQTAGSDVWHDGVINADDSMVLVGQAQAWIVSKVASDGTLDTNFGSGGHTTISNGAGVEVARRVFRDGTGFVVLGTLSGTDDDVGIARVDSAGALDTNFGTNGLTLHDHGQFEVVQDVVRDFMGRFIVVGYTSATGAAPYDVFLTRLGTDGSLDTTFGTSGWVVFDGGADERGTALTIDPGTQDLIVAGSSGADTLLLRYDSSGALWMPFGTSGRVVTDLSGMGLADQANRVRISGTNIVLVGEASNGTDSDVLVAQFDAVGGADPTFGTSGRLIIDRGSNDVATGFVAANQGGWYLAGSAGSRLLVTHITDTAQVDSGFFEDVLANSAAATHVMLDNQNRIVAVGAIGFSGSDDLGVARILP